MEFPEDLKYTKEHEWIRVESDSSAIMGITEFAQSELGEVVFVELPEAGKVVGQGEGLSVVESTKAASDVYSPVSGTVLEGNAMLEASPDLVNSDPFGEGWMVKFENIEAADLQNLMSAAEYQAFVKEDA